MHANGGQWMDAGRRRRACCAGDGEGGGVKGCGGLEGHLRDQSGRFFCGFCESPSLASVRLFHTAFENHIATQVQGGD